MKIVLLVVLLAVSTVRTVLAEPCSGAELGQVSIELAHDAPEAAERLLDPIAASHPDCPAVLLAQARIEAATGQDSQAASDQDSG